MSKKFFLKKTYAEALRGLPEREMKDEPSSPPDNTPENTPDTEIDEIITIWSSPEKSPFKDAITIESDSSDSIYRPPYRKRVKRQLPMLSSSDESLPSLEEILTEDNVCKLVETTKTKKVQDFTSYPGELFNDLFESFTTVNRGLNVEEIFEVIINAEKYPHSVSVPQYVQKPAAFIINRENLKDPRDIRADGNGVWRIRNKAKRRYRVDHTGKLQLMKTTEVTNRSSYELWRTYSFHKETPNFRRLIIEIHGYPHAILQFYFSGDIEPVVLKPHGNAKSKHAAPYRRVAPSTLNRMIELSKSKTSAKSIMKGVINENGGIESCGPSSYPRNEQQVKNIRRTNKEEMDEATEVLHMYDNQEQPFIRKFDVRPDFIVVLASNQQLHDLKRFCTTHPCSIVGIDPTFHFGNFDVTITTYKHPLLQDITPGKHMINRSPVFVGPICVHKKKETTTYFNFFSTLISAEKELKCIKAIGSDGEIALTNAALMAFEGHTQLRCFNHMRKNIQNKLINMGVSLHNRSLILADIFGKSESASIKILGLVDSLTHAEFDIKVNSLKDKWENMSPGFLKWFKTYQEETFKQTMIQTIRSEADLSSLEWYTTNDNESINNAMQKVCGKNLTLPKFITEAKDYVESQENQLKMAIVQEGNYRFKGEYQHLEVPMQTWATWTSEQRKRHIAKVNRCKVQQKEIVNVVAEKNQNICISQPAESCTFSDVPASVLTDMWSKAGDILLIEHAVCKVPGQQDSRRVTSMSNSKTSHYVEYTRKSGRVSCDCYMYKLYKICQHAVAGAEDIGVLNLFITWRNRNKNNFTLTAAVNSTLPSTAGKKPTDKSTWKRHKTSNATATVTTVDGIVLDQSAESNYIFRFLRNTRIMVCYGCGKKFRQNIMEVPEEPQDIVIARKEFRQYVNEAGLLKMSFKKEFVHYHTKKKVCTTQRSIF
ncbi:Hypothetical predicted protein [Mytilus galloprovincialis]|uniref:SWIM-type domain-containing protein n=1 Tax=Mytilus galloprovincialis TaxID=29158 RepID=A0A8B6FJH3_MYTGA|nr:Hypothetical predicted protein [Mytilus galloprovincialis]